jgi:hypothetical protein
VNLFFSEHFSLLKAILQNDYPQIHNSIFMLSQKPTTPVSPVFFAETVPYRNPDAGQLLQGYRQ